MFSDCVQYVHRHPPRCISAFCPEPAPWKRPTILLPSHYSIYSGVHDGANTASFTIACPCGNRSVHLLGYYALAANGDRVFTCPFGLQCPECRSVTYPFFDATTDGFDGEQGVNTNITDEGRPKEYPCPRCGVMPMMVQPNFSYQGFEQAKGEERNRFQDFFTSFDVIGTCTRCKEIIEIAWFKCS